MERLTKERDAFELDRHTQAAMVVKLRELLREADALPKHGHYDSPTGGGGCVECRIRRRITEALRESGDG